MNARITLVLAIAIALTTALGCSKCDSGSSVAMSAEQAAAAKVVSDLNVFVNGEPLDGDKADTLAAKVAKGDLTLEKYVDDLMDKPIDPRLAKDILIAPNTGVKDRHPVPAHSTLRTTKDGGDTIYYLKEKCGKADAEKVEAWWGDEVLICKDSYRPEVKGDSEGRTCGASMLAPRDTDLCGCGPHLMYCTENSGQLEAIKSAVNRELIDTAGYVVNEDMPIEKLFTMNETVRTKNVEYLYRRARVAAGEKGDELFPIDDVIDRPKLQPRAEAIPGQHAGVLTSPAMTYASDALRGVMRNYFEYLWCTGIGSSGVTTQGVMDLKVVDLRVGDGWKDLAAMPICTDCHARLDYGMQFFWGFPSSTHGVDFRPTQARTGKGQMYSVDIKDERGEDELTPSGFARLVTAQPEFGKCMTRKIVDHVFSGTESEADFKAVHDVFESTHKFKPMLRAALVRYAERYKDGPPPPASLPKEPVAVTPPHGDGSDGSNVKITKALRDMLDERCISCHDKGDRFDFNGTELPHRTLALMLDQVAFGAMPKTTVRLDESERLAFVHQLSAHVFADEDDRKTAESYFANGMRGVPMHRYRSAMTSVALRTDHGGKGGSAPAAIESSLSPAAMTYSPSLGLSSAVVGVGACRGAGLQGDALVACVERSTAPGVFAAGPLTKQ
jgi:hypothetical protein